MGEFAAESSRQLRSTKDGPAYAAMLAEHTGPQQLNVPYKPPGKESDHSELAVTRRMSLRDMSRPLCGMSDDTTLSAQGLLKVSPRWRVAKEEPHLHLGGQGHMWLFVMNTDIVSQLVLSPGKGERLMLVP